MGATAYYPPYIGAAKWYCCRCGSECPALAENAAGPCPKCSTEEPGAIGEHNWQFACVFPEAAPNKSHDLIFHCPRCGAVRHDYSHDGAQQTPNYPLYLTPGVSGWQAGEPECRRV